MSEGDTPPVQHTPGQHHYHGNEMRLRLSQICGDSLGVSAYLILAPSSAPTSRCYFPILRNAELMAIKNITRWCVRHARMRGQIHRGRHRVIDEIL